MEHAQSLNHTLWECRYHVVWIPKYRRRPYLGSCGAIWDYYLKDSHHRKSVKLSKGIYNRIMFISQTALSGSHIQAPGVAGCI